MAFQLSDGTGIPVDVPFTIGTTNYPANWLRLSSADEKTAAGITWVADPTVYDSRFYNNDGSAKSIEDYNQYYEKDAEDGSYKKGDPIKNVEGNVIVYKGVKSVLIANEKATAGSMLSKYDWYVTRKAEKGTEIPSSITTYRDAVRTACNTRETEITNCADTAALVTLYDRTEKDGVFTPNMTQYPTDPNI